MKSTCRHDETSAAQRQGDPRCSQNRGLLPEPISPARPAQGRVFRDALELQRDDAVWLRNVLLEAARSTEASLVAVDRWGTRWLLDATVRRQGKSAVIRTVWMVRTDEDNRCKSSSRRPRHAIGEGAGIYRAVTAFSELLPLQRLRPCRLASVGPSRRTVKNASRTPTNSPAPWRTD
jgi:hypothetical protein